MTQRSDPQLPLWPFLIADALLFGAAAALYAQAHHPLMAWEAWVMVVCAIAAALSVVYPFLRRNADAQASSLTDRLNDSIGQIQKIDAAAAQITSATTQLRSVQDYATKTTDTAKDIAKAMDAELKNFTELLQKANDGEKNHLKLEVEKLRRSEVDWLQIVIRILDHVYALFGGAMQSGQRNLIEQIGQFQNACRETARRIGLVVQVASPGDAFDSKLHQLVDGAPNPQENAVIATTLVTGYTYQGQQIRRIVVSLEEKPSQAAAPKAGAPAA